MEKLEKVSKKNSVEEIKKEWKQLWFTIIKDKVQAEGIANKAFPLCFVEQGTVIQATRDFKPLCLKEILNINRIQDVERIIGPPPTVGGWHKFARSVLNTQKRNRRDNFRKQKRSQVSSLQRKKKGRGWIHRKA